MCVKRDRVAPGGRKRTRVSDWWLTERRHLSQQDVRLTYNDAQVMMTVRVMFVGGTQGYTRDLLGCGLCVVVVVEALLCGVLVDGDGVRDGFENFVPRTRFPHPPPLIDGPWWLSHNPVGDELTRSTSHSSYGGSGSSNPSIVILPLRLT